MDKLTGILFGSSLLLELQPTFLKTNLSSLILKNIITLINGGNEASILYIANSNKRDENQRRTGITNLESLLDGVTLPNRFKHRSVPPLWIPEYCTIKGKPRYFSMESPKSPSQSIYVPSKHFGSITNRTLQYSNVFVFHFGHSPHPKSPKLKQSTKISLQKAK